ncbi:PREDICTED: choline/ethanolaminephosphotransferase 1-like [Priapulus caudatus]|uniref:Choline/ethanolaminephosphotransferase 1-like n=1 Tax=Priapulus caudatus TaxID=37621 RepID=A0ABM1EIS9_PRICU|nr:PREDICTED: choline/ethanolaminephosphotransferase 1-like [Priapulus caudatus]
MISCMLSPTQLKRLKNHKYKCENTSVLGPYMQIPACVWLLCALGLFLYQTLDTLDGKQNGRMGTSLTSIVAELFDHGCDSVSAVFLMLEFCISLQLGKQPEIMFAVVMLSFFIFYLAHWTTYVCGYFYFGSFDVAELQMAGIGMFLASAVFGSAMWKTQWLFPVLPIMTVIIPAYLIHVRSPSGLFENYPCLYLIAFGLVSAKMCNRLVVAHMAKSELSMWDSSLFGPALLLLNQLASSPISERRVLWLFLLYCLFDLLHYFYCVAQQICGYFNIYCFTYGSPPSDTGHHGTGHNCTQPTVRSDTEHHMTVENGIGHHGLAQD